MHIIMKMQSKISMTKNIKRNMMRTKISITKEIKTKIKELYKKTRIYLTKLNFNSESESGLSDGEETNHMSKHHNFDNDMASFDKKIVRFIQKNHFHRNVFKFVLGCTPSFDDRIYAMRTSIYENTSNPKWYV